MFTDISELETLREVYIASVLKRKRGKYFRTEMAHNRSGSVLMELDWSIEV